MMRNPFFGIGVVLAILAIGSIYMWLRRFWRSWRLDKKICDLAEGVKKDIDEAATNVRLLPEWKKYMLRFGVVLLIISPILLFVQGANAVKILTHKLCMVAAGIGVAELLWICFFKPVIYRTGEVLSEYRERSILQFRGMLYAAVILALTLGL